MLHIDGKDETAATAARQAWMALLSRAPLDMLESALGRYAGPGVQWLRAPEIGLLMAQGRVGGSGDRFNLGEVTVTRCVLRPDPALLACEAVGVAYVLGRSRRQAELAATADAMLQDPGCRDLLPRDFLAGIETWLRHRREQQAMKAQATRVEFFTVAREAGSVGEEGDEE